MDYARVCCYHCNVVRFSRYPCRDQGIIVRLLKFTGYVHHYKVLNGNNFKLILKNKMAATGVSWSVMQSVYISLIIDPRGLGCKAVTYRKSWSGNLLMYSDLTLGPSFKVKRR